MQTGGGLTRDVLGITVSARIPWLADTGVGAMGVEAAAMVTRSRAARPTGALHYVLGASGTREASRTGAGVPSSS